MGNHRSEKDDLLKRTAKLEKELAARRYALKIESALEKVSVAAMSMRKSKDLSRIGSLIFKELKKLGFIDLRNTEIVINNDAKETITSYYYSDYGVTGVIELNYRSNPIVQGWAKKMKRASDAFAKVIILEKEMKQWRKYREEMGYQPDPKLNKAKTVYYYSYSIGLGALSISSFKPVSTEQLGVLGRFRNVFQLAYQRYADITLATAQAREAEIELAMERVRARTMAMQKSDELAETTFLLFQQLKVLGETAAQLSIGIIKEEQGIVELSTTIHGSQLLQTYPVPANDPYFMKKVVEPWKAKQGTLTVEIKGKQLKEYNKWRNSILKKKIVFPEKQWIINVVFFSKGMISFSSDRHIPQGTIQLLERFAGVFDLTYTRFLDLQRAEAQARESQIQLALERVRARTMAMQRSEELSEAVYVLFQQFKELGENPDQATIGVINEEERVIEYWVTMYGNQIYRVFKFSIDEPHVTNRIYKAWKKGDKSLVIDLSGKELYEFTTYRESMGGAKRNPQEARRVINVAFFSKGLLNVQSNQTRSDESIRLLERFALVFDQTYTRFIDLQKAEAQARESQIQLALERVRARTMAMQKSEELNEVAALLFQQVKDLGIKLWTTGFNVWSDDNNAYTDYITTPQGNVVHSYTIDATEFPVFIEVSKAKKRGEKFWVSYLEGDLLQETYRQLRSFNSEDQYEKILQDGSQYPSHQYNHFVFGSKVSLMFITYEAVPEAHDIFIRFGQVFEQTYTRFLDLQKAEAQAREAQIEAALEKIRSSSLAMHHSNEITNVVNVLFEKLKELGLVFDGGAGIHFFKEGSRDTVICVMAPLVDAPVFSNLPYDEDVADNPIITDVWKAKEEGIDIVNKVYPFEEKNKYFQYVFKHNDETTLPQSLREFILNAKSYTANFIAEKNSLLGVNSWTEQLFSDSDVVILKRVAKVFEQAYVRFLDLQKAEAQAREAQIEAALERVRSRTMAMQKSDELNDVAALLFKQVSDLSIKVWTTGFKVWSDDSNFCTDYVTNPQGGFMEPYTTESSQYSVFLEVSNAKKRGDEFFVNYEEGEQLAETYRQLTRYGKTQFKAILDGGFQFPSKQYEHHVFGSKVSLLFITYEAVPEAHDIFKRFGKVFEQTYTRFLDLQKAEAQAREAQIEAALERVRSRTMAMQRSDELADVAQLLSQQVKDLGITAWTAGFNIWQEDNASYIDWITSPTGEFLEPYLVDATSHPVFAAVRAARQRGDGFFVSYIEGKEIKEVYELLTGFGTKGQFQKILDSGNQFPTHQYNHFVFGAQISLLFITYEACPEEWDIYKRFGKVFEQTYTRFLDLQKAEAQAKEAQIETALERVRSRTLAMQRSDELAETAAVLFEQLIILGINPNRLYINIIKDETGEAEFWITDEDGSKITLAYTANLHDNPSFKKTYDGWKKQNKSLIIDIQGKELKEYFKHLSSLNVPFKGGLSQKRRLQYIAYFSKGFIGMASPDEQPPETMQLLERFAAVFNLTFTRFNDLKIAEAHALKAEQDLIEIKAARKHAEEALVELQVTQKQLIQSEKMASLGELTAGIAHEIQNPLNFVNNFSDVSNELLEEMKTELEQGNTKDVIAIIGDVKQNLEKILHHGKRADAIVKGMLQHSRTSSSQKELTDINALADEYLRLAYHGLRAKDKSFNAKFETDLDKSVGEINIVPQDIGRAVLNLITNAFYVVAEKKKQLPEGYEPTVTVTTKKESDRVFVSVKDNGNGIPQKVLEKIFQPFFTTKPTGQGTGLGLSLAYDIVKAHGGEIKVETQEGEGSEFVIQLPST